MQPLSPAVKRIGNAILALMRRAAFIFELFDMAFQGPFNPPLASPSARERGVSARVAPTA